MRRLRRTPAMRRLVAETRLSVDDLIAPLFVREGIDEPQPIASLPGVMQHTRESLRKEVSELAALGIPGVILFGVPVAKDPEGSQAWAEDGIVQVALRDLRDAVDVEIAGGGDRKGYQQDPRNAREALEEVRFDIAEGADMVMVKPALAYLDVIATVRAQVDVPLAAYHVSGEYAMVQAAAQRG